ncbi:hypothetical protein V5F44_07405 [Xanthobacter sp. V2C-8]|uniref:hypothetical protein n=1 Tax=Xanthobacter albus TaxID=3119929 RepID=UPI00372C565F
MRRWLPFLLLALLWPDLGAAEPFQWLVPSRYELPDGANPAEDDYFDLTPDVIQTGRAWCDIVAVVQKGDVYEITADCSNDQQRARTVFAVRPVSNYRILVEIKAGNQLPGPWNPTLYQREWHPTRVDAKE